MKLKSLKPHYFEGRVRFKGFVYMADRLFGERAIRNGLCEEVKMPTRKDKQHPKTKKGKLQKK